MLLMTCIYETFSLHCTTIAGIVGVAQRFRSMIKAKFDDVIELGAYDWSKSGTTLTNIVLTIRC